jgi:hypothetical protein
MVLLRIIRATFPVLNPFKACFITRTSRACFIWVVSFGIAVWLLGPYRLHLGATNSSLFRRPTPEDRLGSLSIWDFRAQRVKAAFYYAYSNYQARAASHDELLPVSGGHVDKYIICNAFRRLYIEKMLSALTGGELLSLMPWTPCGSWGFAMSSWRLCL